MAHYAQLDENNVVVNVIVVANDDEMVNGVESEEKGIEFCRNLFGGTWKKTSYSNSTRKNFAGIGYIYDETRDAFIEPQPFPSWTLNEETCRWEAPVLKPADNQMYFWNEESKSWEVIDGS
jgi:hypothetical protein